MNLPTVLYVEDEADDVLFMQAAFRRIGLSALLHAVMDGQQAIAYLAGEGAFGDRSRHPLPAVVLLDLNLPVQSGFEVLAWIRRQPQFRQLPVIVFSSSGRTEDRHRAAELGATDYALKPASGMQFGDVVRAVKDGWLATAGGGA
ncbi:MAG: two-component system response regulator [Opitutus sp.]|nr:two-component system response regulator [Opitutus sp.]